MERVDELIEINRAEKEAMEQIIIDQRRTIVNLRTNIADRDRTIDTLNEKIRELYALVDRRDLPM